MIFSFSPDDDVIGRVIVTVVVVTDLTGQTDVTNPSSPGNRACSATMSKSRIYLDDDNDRRGDSRILIERVMKRTDRIELCPISNFER